MGDQDNSENASNQSTSSRNLRFYDERCVKWADLP